MATLLCSFASSRSTTEKLEKYISYLEEMRERNADNPDQLQSIRILLGRAETWLAERRTMHPEHEMAH